MYMGKQKLLKSASAEDFPESLREHLQFQNAVTAKLPPEDGLWSVRCVQCITVRERQSPPAFLHVREPVQEELASRQSLVMQELASSGVWGRSNATQLPPVPSLFPSTSSSPAAWPFPSSVLFLQIGAKQAHFPILSPLKSLLGKALQSNKTFLALFLYLSQNTHSILRQTRFNCWNLLVGLLWYHSDKGNNGNQNPGSLLTDQG